MTDHGKKKFGVLKCSVKVSVQQFLMRLPNKFSEQARKEKGKGIMRMGMVFLARFKVHYGN